MVVLAVPTIERLEVNCLIKEFSEEALQAITGGAAGTEPSSGCFGLSNCCNDGCVHKKDESSKKDESLKKKDDEQES